MNRVVFWGLCAVLVFLPLAYGGVEEWAVFWFEAAVFVLFALHLAGMGLRRKVEDFEEGLEEVRVPAVLKILLGVFLVIAVLQLVPLPGAVLKILSPRAYDTYHSLAGSGLSELGGGGWKTLSLTPGLSLQKLILYIFVFLFGYLVHKHVRTRKEITIIVHVLILGAVFQTLYGLAQVFGRAEMVWGVEKFSHIGSATGTYINRNHFCGLLEMVFLVCVGYMLTRAKFFSMKKGMSLKEKVLWFSQERFQKFVIYAVLAVIIGIGIFFSRSRTGIFVFFVTLFLMAVALSAVGGRNSERNRGKKRYVKVIRTVGLFVLFAVILIGSRPIIERFSWADLVKEQRPVFFKNTVEMIKDFPFFGTGLGTYVYAYGRYEEKSRGGTIDHAHNDYLEFVAESGLVGGVSLGLFALLGVGYVFSRWMKRRDYLVKGVVLGCMGGVVAILIHSLTDFNLHIPANAVYFVTLFALSLGAVNRKLDD